LIPFELPSCGKEFTLKLVEPLSRLIIKLIKLLLLELFES
jgi:hypothetical protein